MNLGVRVHRTSLALGLVSLTLALFSLACISEASELNKAGVSLEGRNSLEESIVKFDEAIRLDPRLAFAYYTGVKPISDSVSSRRLNKITTKQLISTLDPSCSTQKEATRTLPWANPSRRPKNIIKLSAGTRNLV